MSILKKNILAIALVAGLGIAGTASAYTITTDGDTLPVLVASADIANGNTVIGVNQSTTVTLTSGDFILGRTVGFTIRYNLQNGATFGATLDDTNLTVGPAAPGWTTSIAAGGQIGDNFVVINLNPPAAPTTLTTGDLLTIEAADMIVAPTDGQRLKNLTTLQTDGNVVSALVQFVDPVTAAAILPQGTVALLKSGDPVVLDCDATDGDTAKRIDVGATATHPAKTYFSSTGAIGSPDEGYINLGSISATVESGFTFSYLATDTFTTVVTGDFSAFTPTAADRHVFLSSASDCSVVNDVGTVNNANGTVTFTYTLADVGGTSTGFLTYLCASVPTGNATLIDASSVSEVTTFTRGTKTSTGASCDLLPLRYNGSVVEVYHINPAANPTAQSFIRVINPGEAPGIVTITAIDDNGNAAAAPITFTIGARASKQLNSDDLENGNAAKGLTGAWGDGAGKWRAVVTGEFANMVVQSLNRNNNDGTVTNLTDADTRGEQVLNSLLNSF